MAENKLCPKCGGQMFMAAITRACVVGVSTDEENPYTILKEGKDKYDIAIIKCARCKESIEEKDLVIGVHCKECGRITAPSDIDSNGICDICNAKSKRSELANASKEDLIKMLLEAEKRTNPVTSKMEERIETATAVSQQVAATEEVAEESNVEAPQPKKRRRRKTSDDVVTEEAEEQTEEVVATTEDVSTEAENLANQQEAPFPDMNLPEEMISQEVPVPTVQEEQPVGVNNDFKMFDDSNDSAF